MTLTDFSLQVDDAKYTKWAELRKTVNLGRMRAEVRHRARAALGIFYNDELWDEWLEDMRVTQLRKHMGEHGFQGGEGPDDMAGYIRWQHEVDDESDDGSQSGDDEQVE